MKENLLVLIILFQFYPHIATKLKGFWRDFLQFDITDGRETFWSDEVRCMCINIGGIWILGIYMELS